MLNIVSLNGNQNQNQKVIEMGYRDNFEKKDMVILMDGRPICPDCVNHKQGEPNEVHDCKNLYVSERDKDGKITRQGQCCCWSEAHGRRRG